MISNYDSDKEESTYYELNMTSGTVDTLPLRKNYHVYAYFDDYYLVGNLLSPKYFGQSKYVTKLELYNHEKDQYNELLSIDNDPETGEGITAIFPFKDNLLFFKSSCYTSMHECDSTSVFKFNYSNNVLSKIKTVKDESYNFKPDLSGSYLLRRENNNLSFLTEEYSEVDVLNKVDNLLGWNYKEGRLISYNLVSVLDKKVKFAGKRGKYDEVIIPYQLSFELENSFSVIYNDELLDKKTLNSFGHYELSLLKNFVFAKHNYAFETLFFQAYFNLFEFNRKPEMKRNRTKMVNDKLTASDSANLRLILNAISKLD